MTHFTTKLTMFALSFAMVAGGATASFGQCHGGGGYGGGGYGGFSRPSSYHAPRTAYRPSCHAKVVQPQLPPPAYGQSGQPYGQGPQNQFPQGQSQGQFPQGQSQGQFPQGQSQGQFPQGQSQGQFPQGQSQNQFPQSQGQAQQGQGQTQQGQAPQGQAQTPQNSGTAGGNQQSAPAGTQNNTSGNTAEMSALQLLAGMSAGQVQTQQPQASAAAAAPQAQSVQPAQPQTGRVGTWIAKLPNNASVRLDLRGDGSFVWTATAKGKTSNFSGNYNVTGGSLTLIRSNDNQRLAGTLTDNAGGFNFKLTGAKDSGLNFARS